MYMRAQLKELLTNYGDIGILWFDGEWEGTWNGKLGKEIYEYCRTLQPNLIINNRVSAEDLAFNGEEGKERSGGDYKTPEQTIPDAGLPAQAEIAERVLQHVRGGSIIALQDDFNGTPTAQHTALINAMPEILAGLRARHLQPVRLDQLLKGAPYTNCS